MLKFDGLLKGALVAVVLVVASGHPDEKLATCCEKVNKNEITEPILDYLVQEANGPCVKAVIFQTETGLYCSQLNAPWVRRKIQELRKRKAQSKIPSVVSSSPSSVSLLSIITSAASPPSPSSTLPSFPFSTSGSETSSGDVFFGDENEEESSMSSTSFW